jgi:hypothetical protein
MINFNFVDLVDDLFKDYNLVDKPGKKVVKGEIHPLIMKEIFGFLDVARQYKNHPLGFLRQHNNAGKNSYQISVPPPLFENSMTFPYVTLLGERVFSAFYNVRLPDLLRKISVNKQRNHFDSYDFWFNFAEKGSSNPIHTHSGVISSVLYISNTESEPTIFEDGFKYHGKPREIILFEADYPHYVEEKRTDGERITVSCNLELYRE